MSAARVSLTAWQVSVIRFVASHNTGFATPQHDGSVFIYSPASWRKPDGSIVQVTVRDRASCNAEVLAILGY